MSLSDVWAGNSKIWEGCPDPGWLRNARYPFIAAVRLEPLGTNTIGNRSDWQGYTVTTRDMSDLE